MANSILEAVKALQADLPNLAELAIEARKEADRPIADVAYIYNGYDDMKLRLYGVFTFELPRGKVTRIDPKPDYREVDQNSSDGNKLVYRIIPLKGESIAREIVEGRDMRYPGVFVSLDPNPSKALRDAADEEAKTFKLMRIEAFKVGRDVRRSGTPGNKLKPDPDVYRWMQEYNPDDELFGEGHRKTDSTDKVAAAIALLTQMVGRAQGPTVQTVEGVTPEASTETVNLPRRKPLEKQEDYEKRVAEARENG